jgi:hypothetical protein
LFFTRLGNTNTSSSGRSGQGYRSYGCEQTMSRR